MGRDRQVEAGKWGRVRIVVDRPGGRLWRWVEDGDRLVETKTSCRWDRQVAEAKTLSCYAAVS